MRILKTTENFDIWLLHLACMKAINRKIQEIVGMLSNHPLSTEGNKSSLQMYQSSTLKHQVIDTIIDPDAFHYLSE